MTKQIVIKGKVQGVFFRKSTKEKAEELNITGTVENEPNGDVLIIATGEEENLTKLESWCKIGPPAAKVNEVNSKIVDDRNFSEFTIQS